MTDLKQIIKELEDESSRAYRKSLSWETKDQPEMGGISIGYSRSKELLEGFVQELQKELTEMEYWRKAYPYLDVPKKDAEIKLLRHVIGEEQQMSSSVGNTPSEREKP